MTFLRIRDIRVPESTCAAHKPERAQGDHAGTLSTEEHRNLSATDINNPVNEDRSRCELRLIYFIRMLF